MKSVFSIIHATRGRPAKAIEAMNRARVMAHDASRVEYIMVCDSDDDLPRFSAAHRGWKMFATVEHEGRGSVSAWNFGAQFSTGEFLVQMQDDLELPKNWDALLMAPLIQEDRDRPLVIAVSDGYRTDGLLCTAIMNRLRYRQQGEFLHAGYLSVFSDDEHTTRAIVDSRAGKCRLLDHRDLVFLHRHAYHDPSVPFDATYARENSTEAYAIGQKLFAERNPARLLMQ